jgi:hypothetical protein
MNARVARLAAIALCIGASSLLALNCGKTSSTSVGATSAISPQQASSYAEEINLRASDVPGFASRPGPAPFTTTPKRGDPCPDLDGEHIPSPTFFRETAGAPLLAARTVVIVERPASKSQPELSTKAVEAIVRCEKHRFRIRPNKEPITISVLPSTPGQQGSTIYGFRVHRCAPISERCQPARDETTSDTYAIGEAPVIVTLHLVSNDGPPPAALEQRLLALLSDRIETHKIT